MNKDARPDERSEDALARLRAALALVDPDSPAARAYRAAIHRREMDARAAELAAKYVPVVR